MVVFYTKPVQEVASAQMKPCILVSWTKKNGIHYSKMHLLEKEEYAFSKEKCEIKIGKSFLKGDLHKYEVHLDLPDIQVDMTLIGEVPAWRPGTGHVFFGKKEKQFFAWLPAVPKGKITGTFSYKNETKQLTGSGYHDHNWGNANMYYLMNHWYWSRVDMGEYTIIASQIVAQKKFGYAQVPIFMVAENGKILADSAVEYLKFVPTEREIEPFSKRPLYQKIIFNYDSPTQAYILTLQQKEVIEKRQFLEALQGFKKRIALLLQINSTYLRMTGEATLSVSKQGKTENLKGEAIWEQFYFGENID